MADDDDGEEETIMYVCGYFHDLMLYLLAFVRNFVHSLPSLLILSVDFLCNVLNARTFHRIHNCVLSHIKVLNKEPGKRRQADRANTEERFLTTE